MPGLTGLGPAGLPITRSLGALPKAPQPETEPYVHIVNGIRTPLIELWTKNLVYASMAEALRSRADRSSVSVEIRDVAYAVEDTPDSRVAEEKIVLGAPWFINSQALGLSASPTNTEGAARVVGYVQDLHDPTRATVVLDHDLTNLSRT